ncbi:helix-turn-helix transcriptional regulator [Amycolatopsis sp. DSM 110486]|uniref:helix-turn-helix domain-containing protein n=1 Tax=Amycolatopsis sp. DSM 110486 TaxID=2865832 RepID=UPI001C6A398A|nr:helix-turn-helix transcriptional regulator [Amycolatopsis sp. DSM 110486]QYN17479.1 helix-turn-helix domain-containing protein [Amycolatopsis sp. DSM 110486]
MSSTRDTPRLVELGLLLAKLRKAAGLDQREAAEPLGRASSHISRWENAKLRPEEEELADYLRMLGATSEQTVLALKLWRDAADPNFLTPGIGREYAVVTEYERLAEHITNFQPTMIPGPLQTWAYARSVIAAAGATSEQQVEDWTNVRMKRREAVLAGPVRYEAIIGEHALRYPACSREIAIPQLHDLMQTAELPHMTIRVLRFGFGYDPGREGSFVLIEGDESKPVVHLEQYRSASTLTNARDVKDYTDAAERLRRASMSPVAAVKLIGEIVDEMERT